MAHTTSVVLADSVICIATDLADQYRALEILISRERQTVTISARPQSEEIPRFLA